MRLKFLPTLILVVTLVGSVAVRAMAADAAPRLTPDGLVLVVNKQQPAGRELAERYAKLRGVPDGRIVEVDVPDLVEIDATFYERRIADVVRAEIEARDLRGRAQCLVTFHGVPLRVREREASPADRGEVAQILDPMLDALRGQLRASVGEVEALATRLDPTFTFEAKAEATEQLRQRGTAAEKSIEASLRTRQDPARSEALAQLAAARKRLTTMPAMPAAPAARPTTMPTQAQVNAWIAAPDDPAARRELREALYFGGNVFQLLVLAEAQKRTLTAGETEASVDSELSCLWVKPYPRAKWVANPFHHGGQGASMRAQFVRVARIDGPTAEVARRSFEQTLVTEQRGLAGDVVLDARGLGGSGGPGSYEHADTGIRGLARLIGGAAGLRAVFDNNPDLLPDKSSERAALYCGWYSVRKYRPTASFLPGAVAFHIASYEMVALRPASEQGWCRGLMLAGADVTLGPVGEPYLVAFPPADEFFGMLLTGRASVAEAYWATVPITSWKMVLVGDPLYRPFAKTPAIGAEALAPPIAAALPASE